MTIFKKIVCGVSVITGVFFLMNVTSDIQFGFGLMFIITGVLNFPTK